MSLHRGAALATGSLDEALSKLPSRSLARRAGDVGLGAFVPRIGR